MKKWNLGIFIVFFALICVGVVNAGENGFAASGVSDPLITVGSVWSMTTDVPPAFQWGGWPLPVDISSDPFTYSSTEITHVMVTDDYCKGDVFKVFDGGVLVGTTSNVVSEWPDCAAQVGPVAAYTDPTYSHGCFTLPAGDHSIEIQLIQSYWTDSSTGTGFIQVLEGYCPGTGPVSAPEFPSAFLSATLIIGMLGVVLLIQRTREH
jgi:hypothetical protein